jgi:hypothetical protein
MCAGEVEGRLEKDSFEVGSQATSRRASAARLVPSPPSSAAAACTSTNGISFPRLLTTSALHGLQDLHASPPQLVLH